jgi:hypothetical protein
MLEKVDQLLRAVERARADAAPRGGEIDLEKTRHWGRLAMAEHALRDLRELVEKGIVKEEE